MTDNARPEGFDPQREVNALSDLPDDSRVHIEDIEWPEADWSDADDVTAPPAPPPVVLRLVVPEPEGRAGGRSPSDSRTRPSAASDHVDEDRGPNTAAPRTEPSFGGRPGQDWRPAVPFWLRMPEPDPEPTREPPSAEPQDWRPAVPFWLRMPPDVQPDNDRTADPAPAEPQGPDAGTEPTHSAEFAVPSVEQAPSVGAEPDTVDAGSHPQPSAHRTELVDELPPEEDLTPLPGTTGEAVFFPPSSRRTFAAPPAVSPAAAEPEAVPAPRPAASTPSAAAGPRTSPTARAGSAAASSFAHPSAPYAQYDTPDPDWSGTPIGVPWAVGNAATSPFERRPPQPSSGRDARPGANHRRWLVRGAVIGSVIGALVVSLVAVLVTQGHFASISGTITGAPLGAPEDVVSGYLNALAHSDSQQALGYAKLRPSDQLLLTDEVLTASNKEAPLRQVSVHTTELTDYRAQVDAAYTIGDQKVTQSFTVYAVGTEWKLYDIARKVDLSQLKTGDLPLSVNGVDVAADSVELFPGHYQLATSDERYAFTTDTFVVSSPAVSPTLDSVKLELTTTGVTTIVEAATAFLNQCLAAHELQPAGCGFGAVAPKGTTVRTDTMRWKATKGLESLKMMRPTLDPDNPRLATAEVLIQVSGTAKDAKGGDLGVVDSVKTVLAGLGANGVEITLD